MKKDKESKNICECGHKHMGCGGVSGGVYGVAFVGALVYYLQNAANFSDGLIGVFKAIFWPAFLIYELLRFLQM